MDIMNNVIHASADADLTGHTYTKVYAGTAASPTINGTTVTIAAGHTIEILVKSISSTANVFVIGYKKVNTPSVING